MNSIIKRLLRRPGRANEEFVLGGDLRATLLKAWWEPSPDRVVARIRVTNCSDRALSLYDKHSGPRLALCIRGLADDLRGDRGGWTPLDVGNEELLNLLLPPESSREMTGSWRFRDPTQAVEISVLYRGWTTTFSMWLAGQNVQPALELPVEARVREYKAAWELPAAGRTKADAGSGSKQTTAIPSFPLVASIREFGREVRAGLLALKRAFFGPAPQKLFMSRVQSIRDEVLGNHASEFKTLLAKALEINVSGHLEDAEPYFSKAFELFRDRHRRYQDSQPGKLGYLVTWKYEYTGLGTTSRPTIDEALLEAFLWDIYTDYPVCLDDLARKNPEAAQYAERRKRDVEDYYEALFRRAALTLRSSLWKDAIPDSVWDPIRDTEFFLREVMKDPNFEKRDEIRTGQ